MNLPLFPLRTVLFPGMTLPLHIFEPRYRLMIEECLSASGPFGIVLIRSGREVGEAAVPHVVGTLAHISSVERLADGRFNIEAVGQQRFRILGLQHDRAYLAGTVEEFPLEGAEASEARRLAAALVPWLVRYLRLLGEKSGGKLDRGQLPSDAASIGYLAGIVAQIPMTEKQLLLSMATATELLDHERAIYRRETALLRAILKADRSTNSNRFPPN